VGDGTRIEGAIVDKNCRIGKNVRVCNESGVEDSPENECAVIRDGVVVVIKEATVPDGWRM
jgi:glucose-1-phosphate adenylyltransferase